MRPLHLQSSRQPEECVDSTKEKCAHKKRRHAPECPEQKRILLWIMMGRMGQVSSELACGASMALLASRHDILSAQMRLRIGNGQNIMGTMAVIALCRFGVSKLRHFAMVGIEIRFCNRLMTATALLHDFQFETGLISPSNCVCRVTIVAYGQWFVRLSHERCVNAPLELFLYAVMAATASLRNIFPVYARQCVRLGQNAVWRVAASACGGDRETALHEPFAMDTLRVVLYDLMLRAGITRCRLLPLPMASRTQCRDIGRKRRRVGAKLSENAVSPVAFLAGRTVRIVLPRELSVYAYLKLLRNLRVA